MGQLILSQLELGAEKLSRRSLAGEEMDWFIHLVRKE